MKTPMNQLTGISNTTYRNHSRCLGYILVIHIVHNFCYSRALVFHHDDYDCCCCYYY